MQKLTYDDALIGETLRWAGRSKNGWDLVLVFESNNWAVLTAEAEGDSAAVDIDSADYGARKEPASYLSPDDLFAAGLCNAAYRDHLIAQDKARKADHLRQQMERTQQELAKLEGAA